MHTLVVSGKPVACEELKHAIAFHTRTPQLKVCLNITSLEIKKVCNNPCILKKTSFDPSNPNPYPWIGNKT